MLTRSIWLITTQKVLKTRTFKSMKHHYLGSNQGGLELFLKIWEKIMRFVEENPRITIILIIRVSSFSFLMFYPKFMMYQTSIML